MAGSGHREIAFYTVTDSGFFPGAVALLNSLRLVGETAPFFVVDCGLTADQRAKLEPHATVIPRYEDLHPMLQKATGPTTHPAELMVVIDADIIVTAPLGPLFEHAEQGYLVVFEDDFYRDRFFPEWSSLGLGTLQRRRYVNSGFLVFSRGTAQEFLPPFVEMQKQLEPAQVRFGGAEKSDPFFFGDQDVLNGMLSTEFDERARRIDYRLIPVPPFAGVRVASRGVPLCSYADGVAPYALHHILEKPWLKKMVPSPYSEIFRRVVSGPEAELCLRVPDIPMRLSDHKLAPLDRWRVDVQLAAHRTFRGKLGIRPALERRLEERRARKPAEGKQR